MKFLVLKHHPSEDLGNIACWLTTNKFTWHSCEFGQATLANIEQYDALIVLGGPMHIDPLDNYLSLELTLIKQFVSTLKPTLGICLGAQLIAYSLSACVTQMETAEQGWLPISTVDNRQLIVAQWHEQQCTLPIDAKLMASSTLCKVQMFEYKQHVLATQFHPEWNNLAIEKLRDAYGSDCPLYKIDAAQESMLQTWWFATLDNWIRNAREKSA